MSRREVFTVRLYRDKSARRILNFSRRAGFNRFGNLGTPSLRDRVAGVGVSQFNRISGEAAGYFFVRTMPVALVP